MESDLYDSLENLNDSTDKRTSDLDVSKYVPLYDGEKPLEAIKPKAKLRCCSKIPIKCEPYGKDYYKIINRHVNNKTNLDLVEFRGKNSYVSIFQAKNARFKKIPILNDTARSQIGDFTERTDISESSNVTHFSDAKSSCSDTTSFYFDMIKKVESGESIIHEVDSKNTSRTDTFNLKSVSEYSFAGSTKTKKSKFSTSLVVPRLGGLGPDLIKTQEKLSRLQKQKSYGQKASDQNRIKILEVKVLKKLKDQTKDFKS